jgi:hypothetical protein
MLLLKLGIYLQTYVIGAGGISSFLYKRPDGISNLKRPDGTSTYKRP